MPPRLYDVVQVRTGMEEEEVPPLLVADVQGVVVGVDPGREAVA